MAEIELNCEFQYVICFNMDATDEPVIRVNRGDVERSKAGRHILRENLTVRKRYMQSAYSFEIPCFINQIMLFSRLTVIQVYLKASKVSTNLCASGQMSERHASGHSGPGLCAHERPVQTPLRGQEAADGGGVQVLGLQDARQELWNHVLPGIML